MTNYNNNSSPRHDTITEEVPAFGTLDNTADGHQFLKNILVFLYKLLYF